MKTLPTKPLNKLQVTETLDQVKTHERYLTHYRRLGLCEACAAQAGYGHQMGFSGVRQPCLTCRPIVATFSTPRANLWRSETVRAWSGSSQSGTA